MTNDEMLVSYIKGKAANEKEIRDLLETDESARENLKDLVLLEKVLRLNKWNKEVNVQLKNQKSHLFLRWKPLAAAAICAFVLAVSYLALNKNYLADIIIESTTLRSDSRILENPVPQEKAYQDFLMGKASYHAKEYKRAIEFYKKAIAVPNLRNHLFEAIKWHLCVAYLQNNQLVECEKTLLELEAIKNKKYKISEIDKLKLKTQLWLKKTF